MNWKLILASIYTILIVVCSLPIVFVRQVWFFAEEFYEDIRKWMRRHYGEWMK